MNTILIYGNNKISSFLHTAFGESGLLTVDITQRINSPDNPKDIYAVLDVSNADISIDETADLIHNTAEIKDLIDLAHKVKSPYVFLYREREGTHPESSLVTALDLVKAYCEKINIKYATVQMEDVYGPEINTSKKLEEFITGITSGSNILTVDADENDHYLMHQKDFRSGLREIIKTLNDPDSKSKHYTLYPEDPITEIELAHFLKELTDFDLEIVYSHDETPASFVLPEAEINYPENWWPGVELKSGIEDLCDYYGIPMLESADEELGEETLKLAEDNNFDDYPPHDAYDAYDNIDSNPTPEPEPIRSSAKPGRKPKKAIAGLAALLLVALSLPSLTFAYNAASGIAYLNKASENIQDLNLNEAYTNSELASTFLNKIETVPFPLSFIANKAGIHSKDQHLAIETTKEISQAITYLAGIDLYATYKNLDSEVLGASTVAEPEYIDKSLEKIAKVESNFESLETRNKYIRDLINRNLNSLNKNKDKLYKIKAIEPALSDLLGYKTQQTYLLLVQNINTSRSSGGKVEVFGILKAEDGTFTLSKLEKSEDSHAQIDLNGKIPAPEPIRAISGQEYLYIEDVTWDPDFKNASKTAVDLYSYIGNEKIDGVISVDTTLIKNLITTIGEIRIGEKVITAETFEQSLVGKESSDLIKDTFTYIFDTFKNNPESFRTLEPLLYSALNNKNMMVFHKNESTYSNILENDWGGTLNDSESDEFLYFANNNLTDIPSSKITSEILYEGLLPTDDQGYSRTIEIKYINNGDSDYLGHLMALTPKDTLIGTAKLISDGGEKNVTRSIKLSKYEAKALYEMDLYIPAKQAVNLRVEYTSPLKDYKDKYIDISLQKQPGYMDIPLTIKLVGNNTSTSVITFDRDKELKFPL